MDCWHLKKENGHTLLSMCNPCMELLNKFAVDPAQLWMGFGSGLSI